MPEELDRASVTLPNDDPAADELETREIAHLRAAADRLEALIANIQAGVLVEDDNAHLVLTNQAFCDLLDFDVAPQALVGANIIPLARQTAALFADPEGFIQRALELRRQHHPVQAEELYLRDGRVWERDYVPVFPGGEGGYAGHLWLLRDVTERHKIEQQLREAAELLEFQNTELARANALLEELATTDGLTGLLNHRVFTERLAEEFRRARRYAEPLSLVLLDVDYFKAYNDDFGHLAGNSALSELALVLKESVRETDLPFRFGGEEFALLLPHTEAEEALRLAERVRMLVEAAAWKSRAVTVSLGVSVLTPDLDHPDALIVCADAALYLAKAGGRNRVALAGE